MALAQVDRTRTLLVAVIFSTVIVTIGPAQTLAKCNPNRADNQVYYWDGRGQTPGGTMEGVSSHIYVYSPWVWPSGRFSWAWVMLTRSGNWYWAQIGPEESVSGYRSTRVQWASGTPGSLRQMDFGALAIGSTHTFAVNYIPSTYYTSFMVDGGLWDSTYLYWPPQNAQMNSEISSLSTQMMGAVHANEVFSSNQLKYSESWHTFTGPIDYSNYTYFGQVHGTNWFDGWDLACQY